MNGCAPHAVAAVTERIGLDASANTKYSTDGFGAAALLRWLAPECLRGGRATTASDIYSFGLVMFELLTWKLPFPGGQPFQARQGGWKALHAAGVRLQAIDQAWPGRTAEVPPGSFILHPQMRRWVLDGVRPQVPPPAELPGPDAAPPAALETYCSLMRACWAQEAEARPPFTEIMARLGALAELSCTQLS